MSKKLVFNVVIFAALLCSGAAHADEAQDIVANADKVRNPGAPFRSTTTLIEYRSGAPVSRSVFSIYSKLDPKSGQFRDVMRYEEPPRDAGKMLLLSGRNFWFYDPASQQSVRISPQERLTGQASAGDILTENLAVDYAATLLGIETVADAEHATRSCWHLNLKATNDAATYGRVEYWVEQGTFTPVKAKFYADSGQLLKTLYYRHYKTRAERKVPTQAVIVDAVDATLVTTVDFGNPVFRDIPDSWFQRDFLPRLKLN